MALIPEEMLQQSGDKALGIISVIPWNRFVDNPANKAFVADYHKKYGANPNNNAASAYEQMSFLLAGLKATNGDTNPDVLLPAIRKQKLSLPCGTISYNPDGVAIGDKYIVKVEKVEGKIAWVPVKKYSQILMKSPDEK